jgi:type II secretory pathway pseudopilin PulG
MFSLIITVIAIALVAALALATLYYGGPIFNAGAERAQAAKLSAQGQQIMGAMELYRAEKGVYPQSLNDLVADEYLKSIPVAQAEEAKALASAFAASTTWTLSSPGQPVIVLKPVSLATCKAYNQANVGMSGVLQQAHSTKLKQCVGTDVNNLMIIQPKAAADLIYVSTDPAAVVQIGAVLNTPIPTLADTTTNGWLDLGAVTPPTASSAVLSSTSFAFGSISAGEGAIPQMLTVTNGGTAPTTLAATAAIVPAPFVVTGTTCNGTTLAPNASCTVDVSFSPSVEGSYSGASYVMSIVGASGTLGTVSLNGTATASVLQWLDDNTLVDMSQLVLDQFALMDNTYVTYFDFKNLGASPIVITSVSGIGPVIVEEEMDCPLPITLSTGSTCWATVRWNPSKGVDYSGVPASVVLHTQSGTTFTLPVDGLGGASVSLVSAYGYETVYEILNSSSNVGTLNASITAGSANVITTTCPSSLEFGVSCLLTVTSRYPDAPGGSDVAYCTSYTNDFNAWMAIAPTESTVSLTGTMRGLPQTITVAPIQKQAPAGLPGSGCL